MKRMIESIVTGREAGPSDKRIVYKPIVFLLRRKISKSCSVYKNCIRVSRDNER